MLEIDCPVEEVSELAESEVDEVLKMVDKDTGVVVGEAVFGIAGSL